MNLGSRTGSKQKSNPGHAAKIVSDEHHSSKGSGGRHEGRTLDPFLRTETVDV